MKFVNVFTSDIGIHITVERSAILVHTRAKSPRKASFSFSVKLLYANFALPR